MTLQVCVVGAGAVGSFVASRLCLAGHDVSVIARGVRELSIKTHGLRVRCGGTVSVAHPHVVQKERLGIQDIVFITTKAHALHDALSGAASLIGAQTLIVPAVNGVPYWYFLPEQDSRVPAAIEAVDPGGQLLGLFPPQHLVGAVLYLAAEEKETGIVEVSEEASMVIGPVAGAPFEAIQKLASTLTAAGIGTTATPRIRDPLWAKMLINLATNPLSVVADASISDMMNRPELLAIVRAIGAEIQALAVAYDCPAPAVEALVALGRRMGAKRTSMLQDSRRGKALEIDAIGGALVELASRKGMALPVSSTIIALARDKERRSHEA